MNSNISLNYSINLNSCTLDNITALIKELLPLILEDVFTIILLHFGQKYKDSEAIDKCDCSHNAQLKWAHKTGRKSIVKTQWGDAQIPQLQMQCTRCQQKKSMARPLLEMKARTQVGQNLKENVALLLKFLTEKNLWHTIFFPSVNSNSHFCVLSVLFFIFFIFFTFIKIFFYSC